jgi:hypothetical protein
LAAPMDDLIDGLNIDDLTLDDEYLRGLAVFGSDELEELAEYAGVSLATEAQPGGNNDSLHAASNLDRSKLAALEQRRKQQKIAKAKRWMLDTLVDYEAARSEEWRQRYVQAQRIFDTIAFALHYLAEGRLTFGGFGQEWQLGLAKEISRLTDERDELLVLDALQPTLLIVSKLLDFAPEAYSAQLFAACKLAARRVFDRHAPATVVQRLGVARESLGESPESRAPLQGRAREDLYKVFNNIACLLLQMNEGQDAETWVNDATTLVHDDMDEADAFLCNSASLIGISSDSTKPIENLLLRAQKVTAEAASSVAQALATLQEEIQTRKDKIALMSDSFLAELPPLGDEFLVRVDGEKVRKIGATIPQVQAEVARLEAQVITELQKQEKVKLRVLRVVRKLANFYAHRVIQAPGPALANKYGKNLIDLLKNTKDLPLKDDISNACAIAGYYMRWMCKEDKVSTRKEYAEKGFQTCKRAIDRLEATWGREHTSKRAAELYEKGSIAAMLTRQDDSLVQEWCVEVLRLQKYHGEGSLFHARALLILAEGFGYCGDAEQGLISGKDAHAMYVELLGAGHMVTKKVNKIWIEHKKVMMKGAGHNGAKRIFISRMDQKSWIREWL